MNYIYELTPDEIVLLDRICIILSHPAINKSLLLNVAGIERMVLVNYTAGKRCSFTPENIQALRVEILKIRAEINNAFSSCSVIKVSQVLKNKEILYTNILDAGQQVRLSPVRTGKRKISPEEIREIRDTYLKLALQMNL